MKKIITLLSCLMYSYGAVLEASTFTIGVCKQLLDQNSSLMIYMIDQTGHQCIGKCQLDSNFKYRKILQNDLKMTTLQEAERFDAVVDLMDTQETLNQDVVILHFE